MLGTSLVREKANTRVGIQYAYKRNITISETIKTVGEYVLKIKLFQGITADLKLIVKA